MASSVEKVSLPMHMMGELVRMAPWFWIEAGNMETSFLSAKLKKISIDRPVFIAGLARAGSTFLLEVLAAHKDTSTHKNRDFPLVFAPYMWSKLVDLMPGGGKPPVERAHGDRLLVSSESPEAMEEPIWMSFFPGAHNPQEYNALDAGTSHKGFEKFFTEHIKKIMLLRGGGRYVSKGNYNAARITYLSKLFSGGLFVVPVRSPVTHIGSLLRQHERFLKIHGEDSRARAQMRQAGHFEFGADLAPLNLGKGKYKAQELNSENRHAMIKAWAGYWAEVYGYINDLLESDGDLKKRTQVVRFESLMEDPKTVLGQMLSFCTLPDDGLVDTFSGKVSPPDYYDPGITEEDRAVILDVTSGVRQRFGY